MFPIYAIFFSFHLFSFPLIACFHVFEKGTRIRCFRHQFQVMRHFTDFNIFKLFFLVYCWFLAIIVEDEALSEAFSVLSFSVVFFMPQLH